MSLVNVDDVPFEPIIASLRVSSHSKAHVGKSKDVVVLYNIEVHFRSGAMQMVRRRYSAFSHLHDELKKKSSSVGHLSFPGKGFGLSDKTLRQRQEKFDEYLSALLSLAVSLRDDPSILQTVCA